MPHLKLAKVQESKIKNIKKFFEKLQDNNEKIENHFDFEEESTKAKDNIIDLIYEKTDDVYQDIIHVLAALETLDNNVSDQCKDTYDFKPELKLAISQQNDLNLHLLENFYTERCLPSELYHGPSYYLEQAKKNNPKKSPKDLIAEDFECNQMWKIEIVEKYPYHTIYISSVRDHEYELVFYLPNKKLELLFNSLEELKQFFVEDCITIYKILSEKEDQTKDD